MCIKPTSKPWLSTIVQILKVTAQMNVTHYLLLFCFTFQVHALMSHALRTDLHTYITASSSEPHAQTTSTDHKLFLYARLTFLLNLRRTHRQHGSSVSLAANVSKGWESTMLSSWTSLRGQGDGHETERPKRQARRLHVQGALQGMEEHVSGFCLNLED